MNLRQIDAAVATAMGLETTNGYIFKRERIPCPDGNPGCLVAHYGLKPYPVLPYTSDIAAATEAKYWLYAQTGIWLSTLTDGVLYQAGQFWTDGVDWDWRYVSEAHLEAEAICLAFLKARGVEVAGESGGE